MKYCNVCNRSVAQESGQLVRAKDVCQLVEGGFLPDENALESLAMAWGQTRNDVIQLWRQRLSELKGHDYLLLCNVCVARLKNTISSGNAGNIGDSKQQELFDDNKKRNLLIKIFTAGIVVLIIIIGIGIYNLFYYQETNKTKENFVVDPSQVVDGIKPVMPKPIDTPLQSERPTLTLVNNSERPALVRIIGPTTKDVEVPAYGRATINVAGGYYNIKIRFGTADTYYSYSKGEGFSVTETSTWVDRITITFNVADGNYGTNPINSDEFWR